jgi:hypothetical protein
MGAVNLLTPHKRAAAAALVKTGRTVSLSRVFEPDQHVIRVNERGTGGSVVDYYGFLYHGVTVTHVDALCHVWDRNGMCNGRDPVKEIDTNSTTPCSSHWRKRVPKNGVTSSCSWHCRSRLRGTGSPVNPNRPVPALMAATKRGPGSLRVGVPREYFFIGLQTDVQAAVEQAIGVLSKLTAGVRDVVVPVSPEVNTAVMLAEGFAFHAARLREAPQLFQPPVLGRLRGGEAVGTATYIDRRRELDQMRRAASGLFTYVDLLVTPTVPLLPIAIAQARDDQAGTALVARNTRPFNAYGLPAVSVPCGFAKNGLPIGLQIVGPPWGEESVLRLAHAFEQTTESRTRRPAL